MVEGSGSSWMRQTQSVLRNEKGRSVRSGLHRGKISLDLYPGQNSSSIWMGVSSSRVYRQDDQRNGKGDASMRCDPSAF